jgi:hypothetical protein
MYRFRNGISLLKARNPRSNRQDCADNHQTAHSSAGRQASDRKDEHCCPTDDSEPLKFFPLSLIAMTIAV